MEPIEDDGKKRSQDSGYDRGREAPNNGEKQSINENYSEGFSKGIADDKSTDYDSAIPNITDIFDFPKDFDE